MSKQRKARKQNQPRKGNRESLDKNSQQREESYTPPVMSASSSIQAKNEAQGQYMSQIENKDIIFGVGPAGTGKTYVPARMAAQELREGRIDKVVIVRPMIGCDEDMGHLPGDLEEKFHPWLEPFFDALEEELGTGFLQYCLKSKKIEAKPLQFMRGKSFKNCWILLDEAQNTTTDQMKMFVTRIGADCKMVISGDITQHDRKRYRGDPMKNGLEDAVQRLESVSRIGVARFDSEDIVRHHLIGEILSKY